MPTIASIIQLLSLVSSILKVVQTADQIYQSLTNGEQESSPNNQEGILNAINNVGQQIDTDLKEISEILQNIENTSNWMVYDSAIQNASIYIDQFSQIFQSISKESIGKNPCGYSVNINTVETDYLEWCNSTITVQVGTESQSITPIAALALYVQNLGEVFLKSSQDPTILPAMKAWMAFWTTGVTSNSSEFANVTQISWATTLVQLIYQTIAQAFVLHESSLAMYCSLSNKNNITSMGPTIQTYFGSYSQPNTLWNNFGTYIDQICNEPYGNPTSNIYNDFGAVSTAGNSGFSSDTNPINNTWLSTNAPFVTWYPEKNSWGSTTLPYYLSYNEPLYISGFSAQPLSVVPAGLESQNQNIGMYLTNFRFGLFQPTSAIISSPVVQNGVPINNGQGIQGGAGSTSFENVTFQTTGSLLAIYATPVAIGPNMELTPQPEINNAFSTTEAGTVSAALMVNSVGNASQHCVSAYSYAGINWGWQSPPQSPPTNAPSANGSWVIVGLQFQSTLPNTIQNNPLPTPLSIFGLSVQWAWLDLTDPANPSIYAPTAYTQPSQTAPANAAAGIILSPNALQTAGNAFNYGQCLLAWDSRTVGNSANFPSDNLSLALTSNTPPPQPPTAPLPPQEETQLSQIPSAYQIGLTARSAWPLYKLPPLSPAYLTSFQYNPQQTA